MPEPGAFSEQVVMITGTRKGIGRHLAHHFAERGARVVGVNRSAGPLDLPGYSFHEADVADEGAVAALMREVQAEHGRLDVLVNNAGRASMNHLLLTPGTTVADLLRTNVVGTFVVSREAAKLMRRRKYGRIVSLGTIATPLHLEGESAYAASKAAVETLTKIMARELAPFGITCNVVAPAPVRTDLVAGVPEEKLQALVDRLALKRFGTVEEVADAVEFFARPAADYVTGQVLYLGGP